MVIKVGINGFGRVGRVVFRTCLQHADLQIAAINDPAVEVEYICYLIKFDSTHGKLTGEITHNENEVKIDDNVIKVLHHKVPSSIPWQTAGVQYVVEASGMFTSLEKASGHLASVGVRRVIVTAPSIDVPMIILGVNDTKLYSEHKVMSCGSSTLYCLAPIVKVLEDNFGVKDGFITSIHAMTPSLKPLDGLCLRGKHWRDHRSIHQNIIPASTGACKALGKIIPQVKDKMTGLAFRVPIVNVSVLDLTIRLKKETTVEGIAQKVEKASKSFLQNIIKISCEETVSSDFIGDRCSCILDVNSSLQLNPDFFKLVCWYENEYSYACRVVDSILFSDEQFEHLLLQSKMTYVRPRASKKQDMVQQTDLCLKVTSEIKYELSKIPFSLSKKDDNLMTINVLPDTKKLISHEKGQFQKFESNREYYKNTELFKIWNDSNKLNTHLHTQQNKNSFYQTNLENTHSTSCIKAQDRLEKVKVEFSKMVNITEDLLRKTYNNKLKFASNVAKQEINQKSTTEMVTNCKKEIKNLDNKISASCKYDQTNSRANASRGDGKPSATTINSKMYNDCSKEDVDSYSMSTYNDKSNYSDYSVNEIKKPFQMNMDFSPSLSCSPVKPNVIEHMANKNNETSLNKHTMPETYYLTKTCPLTKDSSKLEDANYSLTSSIVDPPILKVDKRDKSEDAKIDNEPMYSNKPSPTMEPSNIHNYKEHFTKSINILIDGLSKNFQFQPFSGDKHLEPVYETKLTNNKSVPSNKAQQQPTSIETIATGDITNVETRDSKKLSDQSFSSYSFQPQFSFEEFVCPETNDKNKVPNMKQFRKSEEISMHNSDTSNSEHDKKHTEELHKQTLKVSKTENKTADKFIKTTRNEKGNKDCVKSFANNYSKLNLNIIDEQLKKRNIVIIKEQDEQINSTSYMVTADNTTTEIDEYQQLLGLHKQSSKSSSRSILNTEDVTKHLSTASTVNNGDGLRKQDIYDKLDSTSATDSDNSFRVDERKSQIIQLSDLTTSLDDLERLDKICRIIEISDELSDKLFSALDNNGNDNNKTTRKKWSFKDLCEKIKLDDFCNKVFKNNF